ncbi:DUF1800 domain-containing protein [Actibacterium sp. D379-3]
MSFESRLAEIRFGTGLCPAIAAPGDAGVMLARLGGPDVMAARHPIAPYAARLPMLAEYRALTRQRKTEGAMGGPARDAIRVLRKSARTEQQAYLAAALRRAALTEDGMRERLTRFWADHFTVKGKGALLRQLVSTYVEEAIRPHMTGSFASLLKAAVTHPMMLLYLDQARSVGPASAAGKGKARGLNENLAREVLELHTLGVGAGYGQADVQQLAALFTGLSVDADKDFTFRPAMAEPGAETVLGTRYGGGAPELADIHAALDDLARHPATARHIAGKLAVHFVADAPDPALVDHVAAAFAASGGDLMATYAALLDHPAAWVPTLQKARQPFDFLGATLRALALPGPVLDALEAKTTLRLFTRPLQAMGQPWEEPIGPDGWPEEAEAWITPQGMAARIQWAMQAPSALMPDLPDPRAFVETALGGVASGDLRFAAAAAENRAVGVALVLTAPEFQRR